MQKKTIRFRQAPVDFYLDSSFRMLPALAERKRSFIITDENVFSSHAARFRKWNTMVLKAGEQFKVQETVDAVVSRMLELQVLRNWTLVGIGGGVITDIAGYIASIYMRGIRFGLVPTTLLAMVDASIGGKNGVNAAGYKNMIGTIRQPAFILHDHSFLKTLPAAEWRNGFSEIIKHAAIGNASMFRRLEQHDPDHFRSNKSALALLIRQNALQKASVVTADENESGARRLLNFGHTLGHALESQYGISHGEAISVGMVFSARLSGEFTGFREGERLSSLLRQYGLPVEFRYEAGKLSAALLRDKKSGNGDLNFILLERIGRAVVKQLGSKQILKRL